MSLDHRDLASYPGRFPEAIDVAVTRTSGCNQESEDHAVC